MALPVEMTGVPSDVGAAAGCDSDKNRVSSENYRMTLVVNDYILLTQLFSCFAISAQFLAAQA